MKYNGKTPSGKMPSRKMSGGKASPGFQPDLGSLLVGAAAGAGLMLAGVLYVRKHPDKTPAQLRRNWALDRTLRRARELNCLSLQGEHRYVIFSDHHKGARNDADDFQPCEHTYLAALDFYHQQGYTLIVLGDVEELWEEAEIAPVIQAYTGVLESEARFYPERYLRFSGNHDNAWEIEQLVRRHLDPFFPGIQIGQELVFEYSDASGRRGEILLIHGHQGTLDSDIFDFVAPVLLPFYRELQNRFKIGRTSPSEDDCLRGIQDTQMYRWAARKEKLILIAGHTHRPVWSSMTHLEKLAMELRVLQQLPAEQRPKGYAKELAQKQEDLRIRIQKFAPCNDSVKTKPSYFNTGCCRFEDGDITGLEIVDGQIRLVKWGVEGGQVGRTELEHAALSDIFSVL